MDRRQTPAIDIKEGDAITDSAEAYYLMKQRGITNVIVMGVHTNMCVLGRPFSIRQMKYQGQNVLLMRDMTDTMYNSRSKPYVPHVKGTDLVVEHIEKYWCPTITSTDFTSKPAQTFAEASQPHVVFMIGEREYKTNESLPKFAKEQLRPRGIRSTIIHADADDKNNFPGLLALKTADLLFVSVRRRSLPEDQLALVREYAESGRPIIGIRTASHAFHTKGQHPEGHAEWQSFDPDVLGGSYRGHHGNGITSTLKTAEGAGKHAILRGVSLDSFVGHGSLYQVAPLAKTTTTLVIGTIPDQQPEPVAWTHQYKDSRVFYTSLGQIDDFKSHDFNRLLTNAVFWALDKPMPKRKQ
jgi:type 1 glutamine amidotransferase